MTRRVLSEELVNTLETTMMDMEKLCDIDKIVLDCIATIRDRDNTIAKLQRRISFHSDLNGDLSELCKDLQQQNTLMLSALERILANEFSTWTLGGFIRDTIAQVKALTVSKQQESTVSEPTCEQPNKDSLHVARQNIPAHPTQQISRLAQEVAADMKWRSERNE